MKVRYIYSACVVIETSDTKVLCDPWLTDGIHEGSWFIYPPINNPIDIIGEVNYIYISHIHQDHYDPKFLHQYLNKYPAAKIIVGQHNPPHLQNKMRIDGIPFSIVKSFKTGTTEISIILNKSRLIDIDTALVVSQGAKSIVNMNDNPIDMEQIDEILSHCQNRKATIALLPYCSVTAYPHTFDFDTHEELVKAAHEKEEHFLHNMFSKYVELLKPDVAIPFAGKYYLGGPLSKLNPYRGLPDPIRVLGKADCRIVILEDGGKAELDADTLVASAERTEPYNPAKIQDYLDSIPFSGYDYEKEIQLMPGHNPQLIPLIKTALEQTKKRFSVKGEFWFCLRPNKFNKYICFDISAEDNSVVVCDKPDFQPRIEFFIDDRYLFGLLTRLYHWNNGGAGAQYRSKRVPDINTYTECRHVFFRREVYNFLDVFHI